MTVPAGDKRSPKTGHAAGFHNQILKDLVQRGAHVYVSIGKRRAIVEHKGRQALSSFQNLFVQTLLLPTLKALGLPFDQIRFHRKFGFRQQQGIFVILAHCRKGGLAEGEGE